MVNECGLQRGREKHRHCICAFFLGGGCGGAWVCGLFCGVVVVEEGGEGEEGEREREGSGGEREGEWEPVEWVARFWALN